MAGNIKGITIEINGDTTKLDKALTNVNKSTKDVNKELKQVNNLLKFNPGNADLVAQKQKLLGTQIENTSKKLKTLKDAQAQVDAQYKNGEMPEEDYRAFQREIVATEGKLKSYQGQLKKVSEESSKLTKFTEGATKAFDAIGKAGEKTSEFGKKVTVGVTAPIAGIAAASTAAFNEVDGGLDTIVAKTGATGKAAEELTEVFNNVAGNGPFELQSVGDAVGEINTRLGFTGEKLETASTSFLRFAEINGMDVNSAVQLVTRAMGDAGISADDYASVLDQLNVAGQQSGISIDTLATNLAKYGAPMRALGIDTQNAIALFAGWEKAGVNTEIAFSGMKKAISNWGAEGKDASKEFSATLQKIKEAPSIAEATAISIDAFGAKAGPDLADAIQGGRFAVDDYVKALESSKGSVDSTFEGMEDPIDKVKTASNNMKIALADLSSTIQEVAGPYLEQFVAKLQELVKKFQEMDPKTKEMIVKFGAIAAALGPVIIFIGKLVTAFSAIGKGVISIVGFFGKFGGAITAIKTAFTTTLMPALAPFLPWIAAAVVAIGAIILVVKNWGTIVDWLKGAWQGITEFFSGLWEGIKQVFSTALDAIVAFIQPKFEAIKQTITVIWTGIKTFFSAIWEGIKAVFTTVVTVIAVIIGTAMYLWQNTIGVAMQWIWSKITEIWNAIVGFITPILTAIGNAISTAWTAITNVTSTAFNAVKNVAMVVWNAISSAVGTAVNAIASTVSNVWNTITNATSTAFNAVKNVASSVWNSIKSTITSIVNSVKSTVSGVWESIKSTTSSVWNGIKEAISKPINAAKDAVKKVIDTIKGFFSFKISWPHIPMPHFGISPSGWKIGDLLKGSIPRLDISWHADGGIFNKPTLFASNGGLHGVGEAGSEAVIPLNKSTLSTIGQAIVNATGMSLSNEALSQQLQLTQKQNEILSEMLGALIDGVPAYVDWKQGAKLMGPEVKKVNDFNEKMQKRMVGLT